MTSKFKVGDRVRLKEEFLDAPAGSIGTVVPKQRETIFPSLLVDIDGFTKGHDGGWMSKAAGSKLYISPEALELISDPIPELSAAYRAAKAAHAAAIERTLAARAAHAEAEEAEEAAEVAEQQAAAALLAAIDAA